MNNVPNHVAIIMDGNGRWATSKGKKRSEGHKAGAQTLEKLALHAKKIGIKYLSVYAFSTDNFKRSKEEVDYLMDLLVYYFNNKLKKLSKEGVKVIISGRKDNLKEEVIDSIANITEYTKNNKECTLNICLNYGGQEEIVDASLKIHESLNNNSLNIKDLNRDTFYKFLYQELPPIDLLIRTGNEYRLSNFMLYQASYAELYFSNLYFPDFDEKALDNAINDYSKRERKFGTVK
jgi:undecaprenyl diphosphate synthase